MTKAPRTPAARLGRQPSQPSQPRQPTQPRQPEPVAGDELAARLRVAVTRLNRRLRQESATGISPTHESALATIGRLGTPTLGALAQAERVQPPTMTAVVRAMEAAGLVSRRGDEADRRVSRVALTAEGRRTLEGIRGLKTAYLGRQIARLTAGERADLGALASLLERLVEGL